MLLAFARRYSSSSYLEVVCCSIKGFDSLEEELGLLEKLKQRGQFGSQREFTFPVKHHVELGLALDLFDFETASEVYYAITTPF
jgi:seryl-tRNA synthetase